MKSSRKFAVLSSNGYKLVLPMNQASVTHLKENLLEEGAVNYTRFGYTNLRHIDTPASKSLLRMAKYTRFSYDSYYTASPLSESYDSYDGAILRILDTDVQISHSFYDFLRGRMKLKFTHENGNRIIIADDSLIPESLTESFVNRGLLVDKTDEREIYGNMNIASYHFNGWHPEIEKQFTKFMDKSDNAWNFGFEAEKVDEELADDGNALKIAHLTGFKKEYDGSLGSEGFELISPILPLNNQQVIDTAIAPVSEMLNASTNDSCGGHINLSNNNMSSRSILKGIKGSLPILYSFYEKRLTNRYCPAKPFSSYLRRPTKYSAAYLKTGTILELRLFPAIKNKRILQNRIEMLRLMTGEMFGKTANRIIVEMATPTTSIHRLLMEKLLDNSKEKMIQKLRMFKANAEKYGCGKVSVAAMKKINKLMNFDVFVIPQTEVPTTTPTPIPTETASVNEEQTTEIVMGSFDENGDVQDSADEDYHFISRSFDVEIPSAEVLESERYSVTSHIQDLFDNCGIEINAPHTTSENRREISILVNNTQSLEWSTSAYQEFAEGVNSPLFNAISYSPSRNNNNMNRYVSILRRTDESLSFDSSRRIMSRLVTTNLDGDGDVYTIGEIMNYLTMFIQLATISRIAHVNGRFTSCNRFDHTHYVNFFRHGSTYVAVFGRRSDGIPVRITLTEGVDRVLSIETNRRIIR